MLWEHLSALPVAAMNQPVAAMNQPVAAMNLETRT